MTTEQVAADRPFSPAWISRATSAPDPAARTFCRGKGRAGRSVPTQFLRVVIFAVGTAASAASVRAGSGDLATGDPASTAGALQEVTVTARRTEEKIETVPVAVVAFSAETLKEQDITTETDLQAAVPGLLVRAATSTTQLNYAIRGETVDAFSYTSPTVLTYVDEFQVGGTTANTFYDMQSIQVVKGPQGTLFGRNATGGAVLLTTTQPGTTLTGYLNVDGGNYNDRKGEGAITLPVASWASLRLAGEIEKRDGYEDNVYLGIHNASLDNKNVRVTLRLASDQLENTTTAQYGSQGGYSGALKITGANTTCPPSPSCAATELYPPNVPTGGYNPTLLAQYNGMVHFLAYEASQPFYDIFNDQSSAHDAHLRTVINKTTWNMSNEVALVSISGYNYVLSRDKNDVVGSPFALFPISTTPGPASEGFTFATEQYSEELHLAGKAFENRIRYLFGGYLLRDDEGVNAPLNVGCGSIAFALVPGGCQVRGGFRYNVANDELSRALFAQVDYEFAPGWHATGGYRETWEGVQFEYVHNSEPQDAHYLGGIPEPSLSDHRPSWTLGLDRQITRETLLYLAQRGGFRVGGFNGSSSAPVPCGSQYASPPPAPCTAIDSFKPETVRDFELGIKYSGYVGGLPTRINADVYETYIDDAQRVVYSGVSAQTTNAKQAKIDGLEVGTLVDLTKWLQLGGNYAYTDARYTNGTANFTTVNVLTGAISYVPIILGPYADSPRQSASLFLRVHHDLGYGLGELAFRADVFSQTYFYYTNLAQSQPVALDPKTRIGGYSLVNARVDWNDIAHVAGCDMHASAYVRNLFDKEYGIGGVGLGAVVGTDAVILGQPRMWGVELGVKF